MEDDKRSGNRPDSGAAILLNRIPLQNFLTEHNSPSWNIVGQTHQTSAINIDEGMYTGLYPLALPKRALVWQG